jgi:hypothetical protein
MGGVRFELLLSSSDGEYAYSGRRGAAIARFDDPRPVNEAEERVGDGV